MRPDNATILATLEAHARTKSLTEIAGLLGVSRDVVVGTARKAGFKKPRVFPEEHRVRQASLRQFIQDHAGTHTLAQMGQMLGVSRECVRQLGQKWRIKRGDRTFSKLHRMDNREFRKLIRQPEKSMNAIAREAGVRPLTLVNELHRRGLKPLTKRLRDARLLGRGKRLCPRCRRVKRLEHFTRSASTAYGHCCYCKKCRNALNRECWRRKARTPLRRRASRRATRVSTGRAKRSAA